MLVPTNFAVLALYAVRAEHLRRTEVVNGVGEFRLEACSASELVDCMPVADFQQF